MHSDGTGVLMICRLSLRTAQKENLSSYTASWVPSDHAAPSLPRQPAKMKHNGPGDMDSRHFVSALDSTVLLATLSLIQARMSLTFLALGHMFSCCQPAPPGPFYQAPLQPLCAQPVTAQGSCDPAAGPST